MKPAEFKDIAYDKDEQTGIVTVVLNTPARKNALSAYSFLELWWAADNFQKDEGAHVMIITGARDPNNSDPSREAFSSGGYFNPDATDGVSPQLLEQLDPSDIAQKRLVEKMCYLDKPVIAAVNGLAIGGLPVGQAESVVAGASPYAFSGRLADIRLFDRALSKTEIQAL